MVASKNLKKKSSNKSVQPEKLPTIDVFDIFVKSSDNPKGSFLLNPFIYHGEIYRIVGYDIVADTHSILHVASRTYKDKPTQWLKKISGN